MLVAKKTNRKLNKAVASNEQIKSQGAVVDGLNKKFMANNRNKNRAISEDRQKTSDKFKGISEPANKIFKNSKNRNSISKKETADSNSNKTNNKLEKINGELEKATQFMQTRINRARRSVRRRLRSGDLIKDSKSILKEYHEDYKNLTLDNLKKFQDICDKYDVTPSDKLDYEIYRRMLETIRISSKEKKLTPEQLKMLSRKIFNELKQAGEADNGQINGIMHPFLAFVQLFMKIPLFLHQLIKQLSSDNYSLFQIRNIKKEIENTVFKKFGIINLTKLNRKEYRVECKEKVARFSEEISLLATALNEGQRKLGSSDSDARFSELLNQFVNQKVLTT